MRKEGLLLAFLLASALAECGNLVCDQSDVVGCPEECTPIVKVFDWENLQGMGAIDQCGKGFGGVYYAFQSNCTDQIEVKYSGDFEVVQWSGIRHIDGMMGQKLCSGFCTDNLVSPIDSPAAELGLWGDGMRRVNLFLRYTCQTIPTVRIEQIAATSVRVTADIHDIDANTKQVNAVLIYPDFSRSSQTMGCTNNKCTSDYPVGGNGTYEILVETRDSFGPVYQYMSDSSCHLFRENIKQDVQSSQKYRFRYNLTIDPCFGIECMDKCEGDRRFFSGHCFEGACQYREEFCADHCLDEVSFEDYACTNGLCMFTSTNNCTTETYCAANACVVKGSRMDNCTQGFHCQSGWCSNGYCCEEGQSCCMSHANCTNSTYCDPFTNNCKAQARIGEVCEFDSQCYDSNCYHNTCCPDGQVCCTKSEDCPFLQGCAGNTCTHHPLLYGVLATGLAAVGFAASQLQPSETKHRHRHRRVIPPKNPPEVQIPDELLDEMGKE